MCVWGWYVHISIGARGQRAAVEFQVGVNYLDAGHSGPLLKQYTLSATEPSLAWFWCFETKPYSAGPDWP